MKELISSWFEGLTLTQGIDIFLVVVLLYQFYKLVKNTSALNITLSIVGIYIIWKITQTLHMPMISEILDRILGMGFLALVVVFQPEIRRFLFLLGKPTFIHQKKKYKLFKRILAKNPYKRPLDITSVVQACMHMSQTKTGALIVLVQQNSLPAIVATGEKIDAIISVALMENIFFKNSPLHDGALIIENDKIQAARCILPVTTNKNISEDLGLRHRSAIGATEQSDALSIIVSEETGSISYCKFGEITYNVTPSQLRAQLEEEFINKDAI